MVLLSADASSNEIPLLRRTRDLTDVINVVSLAFCESNMPAEDNMSKKTMEEVHTYAELKHDPRASFPDSFTVCSTIMITGCQSQNWPTFFNILDNNKDQLLASILSHGVIKSRLTIGFRQYNTRVLQGKVPPLFPNQWTKSCMAVNTTSGLIHWVVEGSLVLTMTSVDLKNAKSRPKDMSKKIVLGARSYGGSWFTSALKVTNLNLYSSPLPIKRMEIMTRGGSCFEEGDYLAWEDMEWILHGHARKETTEPLGWPLLHPVSWNGLLHALTWAYMFIDGAGDLCQHT